MKMRKRKGKDKEKNKKHKEGTRSFVGLTKMHTPHPGIFWIADFYLTAR